MDKWGFASATIAVAMMAACGFAGPASAGGVHGHERAHAHDSAARHHPYHRHGGGFHTRGAHGTARSLGYTAGH